jgi:hypothetical protein
MADVSDESIRKSLLKLWSNRNPLNWLSVTYAEGSSDQFVLAGCGSKGLSELASSLSPTFRGYAYVRIKVSGSPPQFVLIQYVGQECTALQKAKILVHEDDITAVFTPVSVEIAGSDPEDLTIQKVRAALAAVKK